MEIIPTGTNYYCPVCNTEIKNDTGKCPNCGQPFIKGKHNVTEVFNIQYCCPKCDCIIEPNRPACPKCGTIFNWE